MFECSINYLLEKVESNFNDDIEVFCDIHCPDPVDNRKEHIFPVAVLHSTGLHLVAFLNDSTKEFQNLTDKLEYMCRVFKSYFLTKISIRTILVVSEPYDLNASQGIEVYDLAKKEVVTDNFSEPDDVLDFIVNHTQFDEKSCEDFEQDELALKLSKEGTVPLDSELVQKNCFVKRGQSWVPGFKKDSDKVFKLALFGGFLGLHRFYLGMTWTGLLYFFTLGLVGVGWFFDCIEMILGCFNHKGKYLLPLENKPQHIKQTIFVFGGVIIVLLLSLFI